MDAEPANPDQETQPDHESDVGAELVRVCVRAARELNLSGAAITLMGADGLEAIAALSDERIRPIEELQFSLGEGPARDAFESGRPVLTRDLGRSFKRWPGYAPAASHAGVGAVFAFPLQVGAARFGVLSFYAPRARALSTSEVTASLIFAEVVNETLLDGSGPGGGPSDPDLPGVLQFRSEVYQAQGMVMVDLSVTLADALARMRAHAYAQGQDLTGLAREIIAGTTRLVPEEAS